MSSIFSLSIPQLQQWSRREPVDHRLQNEPVDAINRMMTGVGVPQMRRQVLVPPSAVVSHFKLVASAEAFPDHLVCRTWDGVIEGDGDVLVAKPWLLRQTPFDRGSRGDVSYFYHNPTERSASVGSDSELQIIIPRYIIGDVLTADKGIVGGTGVTWGGAALEWEARTGGRAWAAVDPQP